MGSAICLSPLQIAPPPRRLSLTHCLRCANPPRTRALPEGQREILQAISQLGQRFSHFEQSQSRLEQSQSRLERNQGGLQEHLLAHYVKDLVGAHYAWQFTVRSVQDIVKLMPDSVVHGNHQDVRNL